MFVLFRMPKEVRKLVNRIGEGRLWDIGENAVVYSVSGVGNGSIG